MQMALGLCCSSSQWLLDGFGGDLKQGALRDAAVPVALLGLEAEVLQRNCREFFLSLKTLGDIGRARGQRVSHQLVSCCSEKKHVKSSAEGAGKGKRGDAHTAAGDQQQTRTHPAPLPLATPSHPFYPSALPPYHHPVPDGLRGCRCS